nr:hypothetical protein BaRGS_014681 [Batillaria attramentaria]
MLALKRGAHIQLDEVKARMLLLGGEVKGLQVKDVQKDAELKRQRETLKDDVQKYKEHDTEIRIDIAKIKEQLNTATKSVSFHAQLNYGPYKAGDTLTAYRTFNNDGNAYSETSGVFTVPVSGTYIFLANVMVQAGSSRNINDGVFIYVDGKDHGRCWSSYKDHYNQGSCHAIVKLRAGQRVWLYNRNDDSRYYYDSTTFSGALLHAGLS